MRSNTIGVGGGALLVVASFFFAFWPLALLGVVVAALFGGWALPVLLALLLDLLWGVPVGALHALYVPCTLLALFLLMCKAILLNRLRAGAPERL